MRKQIAAIALAVAIAATPVSVAAEGIDIVKIEITTFEAYPVPMPEELQRHLFALCQAHGLPFAIALAIVEQESCYDPRATSRDGAMGLMQLMPRTWAWICRQIGADLDPYNPFDNMTAGCWLLGHYWADMNPSRALMCYSIGEFGAAAAWDAGFTHTIWTDLIMDKARYITITQREGLRCAGSRPTYSRRCPY